MSLLISILSQKWKEDRPPPLLPSDLVLAPGSDISCNPAGAKLAFQTEGLNRMSRQPRVEQQAEGSRHHLQKEQWEMAASHWNNSQSSSVGGSELRSFRRCFSLKLAFPPRSALLPAFGQTYLGGQRTKDLGHVS